MRTLVIHGARVALRTLVTSSGRLGHWLRALSAPAHRNTVIVALANELARIAWAVLRSAEVYDKAGRQLEA